MAITVIAEAGVNHNGSVERALQLVDAAADAGSDIVKFQAFTAESLTTEYGETAAYQSERTRHATQRDMLAALELDESAFERVAARCRARRIEFLCTPFEVGMTARLMEMGMRRIKIASGELTNGPALRAFGAFGAPVLLSTGMADLNQVKAAVSVLQAAGAGEITVLHCTSLYPAPAETLNLRAVASLARETGLPVGYSDHSEGATAAIAACALGAIVVEKHLTLDRSLPGPDHAASMEPAEFADLIVQLRTLDRALGDGVKRAHPDEAATARVARRSWRAARALSAGVVLATDDVTLQRPEDGLSGMEDPIGRRLRVDLDVGRPLRSEDIDG